MWVNCKYFPHFHLIKSTYILAIHLTFSLGTTSTHSPQEKNFRIHRIDLVSSQNSPAIGCFYIPDVGEVALEISTMELAACFTQPEHKGRLSMDDFRGRIDGKASGLVRISVDIVTKFEEVQFSELRKKVLN